MTYLEALPLKCQLGGLSANDRTMSYHEPCLDDLTGRVDARDAGRPEHLCSSAEDPMKSAVVLGWINGITRMSK